MCGHGDGRSLGAGTSIKFGPMKEESDAFIRYSLGIGGVGLATGAHARNVLALTMAADRSAEEGSPVKL